MRHQNIELPKPCCVVPGLEKRHPPHLPSLLFAYNPLRAMIVRPCEAASYTCRRRSHQDRSRQLSVDVVQIWRAECPSSTRVTSHAVTTPSAELALVCAVSSSSCNVYLQDCVFPHRRLWYHLNKATDQVPSLSSAKPRLR